MIQWILKNCWKVFKIQTNWK